MRCHVAAMGLVCLLLGFPPTAEAAWHVWTLKQTRHVLRDEPSGSQLAVNLAAARNEWEGFQILMRAEETVEGINVELGDLAGPSGSVLRGSDASLYRQHQLEMTIGSYRNKAFKPGWYPDPLIPLHHPVTHDPLRGGRLAAVPFTLQADQTHGFWVDLYVPPGAKPGTYQGTCRVTAAGARSVSIPITLTVWDFELPKVPALRTDLGSPAQEMRRYYSKRAKQEKGPTDWDAIDRQCAQMLCEHRINATPPGPLAPVAGPDGSFRVPSAQIDALRQFIDRYHVNAVSVAHPEQAVKDPELERRKLHAWLAAWDRAAAELNRPHVVLYTYLKDEPNTAEEYKYVQKWGRASKAAKSVVKVLVVEQTKTQDPAWGDLYGAVDIWCPLFFLHDPATASQRMALGEEIWTYTALCQGRQPTPWWEIDFPLLNYRCVTWIAWGYHIRGLLYWGGMSFWFHVPDPWTDPKTLDRREGRKDPLFNGEGTLAYPARAVGYEGIAPSLRMTALRDAIEDYDYLAMLDQLGQAAEADKIIRPLAASWFQWDPDPESYEKARAKLAELILRAKK